MKKVWVVSLLGAASVPAVLFSFSTEVQAAPPVHNDAAVQAPPAPAKSENQPSGFEALGIITRRVDPAMTAQLPLANESSLLVTHLTEDSVADRAGLKPFDVLVALNGEASLEAALHQGLARRCALELDVVRQGILQRIILPPAETLAAQSEESPRFLSRDDLGVDHPFRRVEALRSRLASYTEQRETFARLAAEVEKESRSARENAKKAMASLQKETERQVADYLAELETRVLAQIDRSLAPEQLPDLSVLEPAFEELLPEETLDSLQSTADAQRAHWKSEARVVLTANADPLSQNAARGLSQRAEQICSEAESLYGSRVQRPGKNSLQQATQMAAEMQKAAGSNQTWTRKALASIRKEVRDRVMCAVERTEEELARKLEHRLKRLEVPQPGEIEQALHEIRQQIEIMAERFLQRTARAVTTFEEEMTANNQRLSTAALATWPAWTEALATYGQETGNSVVPASNIPPADDSWRARSSIESWYHDLRHHTRRSLNAAQNVVVPVSTRLRHEFELGRSQHHQAWEDFKQRLRGIHGEAANDCWKLDGPHLDGRFPTQPPAAPSKKKAEIAMAPSR